MKRTDKCEICGYHKDGHEFGTMEFPIVQKECDYKVTHFKSHSQEHIHCFNAYDKENNLVCSDCGKKEEFVADYCYKYKQLCPLFKESHSQVSVGTENVRASEEVPIELTSSVPYTSLTKEDRMFNLINSEDEKVLLQESKILSALNGLREDIKNDQTHSVKEEKKQLDRINKWFPIMKESEDRKR